MNLNYKIQYFFYFYFRTSSASEYSAYRDQTLQSHGLSKDLLGPMVVGPIISLDDWVPERPPKNPLLRVPSPDLPPPPPSNGGDANHHQDDPLPPPPPEILRHMRQLSEPDTKFATASRRNSFAGTSTRKPFIKSSAYDISSPPILPRKPSAMELLNPRPFTNMSKSMNFPVTQTTTDEIKAHKVVLNGKLEVQNDARVTIRKRTHNAAMPISEMQQKISLVSSQSLRLRAPAITSDSNNQSPIGNRTR